MAVPSQGMNNLTTLIKRLEAATSRLEDIASSTQGFEQVNGLGPETPIVTTTQALSHATDSTTASPLTARHAPPHTPVEPLPPAISEMDEMIQNEVQAFVKSSKGIDPLVEEQAEGVAKGFADQRKFLVVTTKAKRPDPQSQEFMDLLKDLQQDLGSVGDIKESNRASPMREHFNMVADGLSSLQWLIMDGKPEDYVAEVIGGAQMYGNRVLKAFKDGDQSHVKYVRSFYALLKALQAYIAKHYRTGVTWNAQGIDASQAMRDINNAPATNGIGAPPPPPSAGLPPPPPPLPVFDNAPPPPPPPPTATGGGAGDMGAVFDQLNRGEAVTAGLKKVDKSQMTHKNPSLRASSSVAGDIGRSRSPGPEIKPKPQSMRQNSKDTSKKEGKKELDGNKWLIENWDSPSTPITLEVSLTQSILISRCKNTTIILRGKANAISIDNSPRTQLLIETLVSSVDVIKSPNFAVQITGSLPTIMLDQVDGASIYLGEESLGTEVFTSKCSSINIVLPPEKESDDSQECPLPEQIRTVIKGRRVVSEIVEHAG